MICAGDEIRDVRVDRIKTIIEVHWLRVEWCGDPHEAAWEGEWSGGWVRTWQFTCFVHSVVAVDQSVAWLRLRIVFGGSIGTELVWLDFHEQMKTDGGKVFGGVPVSTRWEKLLYLGSNGVMEG